MWTKSIEEELEGFLHELFGRLTAAGQFLPVFRGERDAVRGCCPALHSNLERGFVDLFDRKGHG
jgi:hypothetical protein